MVELKENKNYSIYRDKIKGGQFTMSEISFGSLFKEMYLVFIDLKIENT
jgi:hypothetical protein